MRSRMLCQFLAVRLLERPGAVRSGGQTNGQLDAHALARGDAPLAS